MGDWTSGGLAWVAAELRATEWLSRFTGRRHETPVTLADARDLASHVLDSWNGGDYRRADPGQIAGAPRMQQLIAEVHAAEPVVVPPAGLAVFEGAIVLGEGLICKPAGGGLDLARETIFNAVFDRSLRPIRREPSGRLHLDRPVPPRRRVSGPHVLLRQIWDTNYGHWVIECLPRLAIVAEHYDLAKVKIVVSHKSRAMRRITEQTLAAFGIRPEQIVTMWRRRPFEFDELIYPLPMSIHPWVKSPRIVSILEEIGTRIVGNANSPRRLYVTRAGARWRHLCNEAEVLRVLEAYGFTIVRADRLSFAEQVRLFASAEIVVGNYGANLTNVVFAPRGVIVFALTSEAMCDDFFWDLTNLKGGRYHALHGPAVDQPPTLDSDFSIDIPELRRHLIGLLGEP